MPITESQRPNHVALPEQLIEFIDQKFPGQRRKLINNNYAIQSLRYDSDHCISYLKTYWPRSFGESYLIAKDLIAEAHIREWLNSLKRIRIMDIGTGGGGNIFGLLYALLDLESQKKIEIHTYDGNDYFHNIFQKIQKHFFPNVAIHCHSGKNVADLTALAKEQPSNYFHFITSFKFVNEIMGQHGHDAFNYYHLLKKFETKLHPKGFFILADTAQKYNGNGQFLPEIMHSDIQEYRQESDKLAILLPLSCAFYIRRCTAKRCYRVRSFYVKLLNRNACDFSQLSYMIFSGPDNCRKILANKKKYDNYLVKSNSDDNYCQKGQRININNPHGDTSSPYHIFREEIA